MASEHDPLAAELGRCVTGPVLAPDDPAFAEELGGFQRGVRHRPALAVGATSARDVCEVLRVAADHGVPVTVHSTGHGLRVPASEGIVVTLRRLGGVDIDPATRTARIDGGARWAEVASAAAPHGLAPPSGSLPSVGAVGYTLGGGLGLLARADGWASDHVRSFTVAEPDGSLRQIGPDDRERFARLRGTGPNPGEVVTDMTIGLFPDESLHGGGLTFDAGPSADGGDPALLHAYAEWTRDLPDELTSAFRLLAFPDADGMPPPLRGRVIARIAIAYRGDEHEVDRLTGPLRGAGRLIEDTLAPLRFVDSARVHAEPEEPSAYVGENLLLDRLEPAGLDALCRPAEGPLLIIGIRHLGGALARPALVPDTTAGRDACYLITAVTGLEGPPAHADLTTASAHAHLRRALLPFVDARVGTSPSFAVGPAPAPSADVTDQS